MENRSWGVELWNQPEHLLRLESEQNACNDQYYRFLLDVQKLQLEYGKKFRKLATSVSKKKVGLEELSYNTAFTELVAAVNDLGSVYEHHATELHEKVLTPLKSLCDSERKSIEKVKVDNAKLTSTLDQGRKNIDLSWKSQVNALREKNKAFDANARAQDDNTLSRLEQGKFEQIYESKKLAFEATQKTYASDLMKYNKDQHLHYGRHLFEAIAELEVLDRNRADCTANLLKSTSELFDGVAQRLKDCSQTIRTTAESISADKDSAIIIKINKLDVLHPVDLPFLNLDRCSPAMLESPTALLDHMLGTTSTPSRDSHGAPSANIGGIAIRGLMRGKGKASGDELTNIRSPFICGISTKPIKLLEMTILQINDRMKEYEDQKTQTEGVIRATQKLQETYTNNPKLGEAESTSATLAKMQRRIFSLNCLIEALQKRYDQLGGNQALAQAQVTSERAKTTEDKVVLSPTAKIAAKNGEAFDDSDGDFAASDIDDDLPSTQRVTKNKSQSKQPSYEGIATAKYAYDGSGAEYLAAHVGEVFYVMALDKDSSGWTTVVSEDGKRHGYVPTAYMEIRPY